MDDYWYTCGECDAEYKVVTTIAEGLIQYCPFCGCDLEGSFITDEIRRNIENKQNIWIKEYENELINIKREILFIFNIQFPQINQDWFLLQLNDKSYEDLIILRNELNLNKITQNKNICSL